MKILAIETSCDETSAAIVEQQTDGTITLISQSTATSLQLHSRTGGIIPEVAAREQSKYIIPVIQEVFEKAGLAFGKNKIPDINAIAVTYGPGLIGSLLVGVETAKTLSFVWNKPLIPVNHLFGHVYANWITDFSLNKPSESNNLNTAPAFPLIALIVSGGHTDLLLMKSHKDITWLGGTRDDAAGECFDKSGRVLGLSYPAGPAIEQKATLGNPKAYRFPRPLLHDSAFDFSFSGLKTAVLREVQKLSSSSEQGESRSPQQFSTSPNKNLPEQQINDICRGLQDAISDVLIKKTCNAAEKYNAKSIVLSGGVAANQTLKEAFIKKLEATDITLFVPPKSLCTDNAAMIGAAAFFQGNKTEWSNVTANPELYFD
ncbi:MAG TPA: tRNA (adenosine(37)-N6)-threonylcarbamoyltransferase complex transferase subunit TsaD [Patescibacteria group bacterium]|nr:tRNA (adenosine(37)-N6)-threonylcarbamoyltransferase complex transferase subunit TsaD [Patescibacteria group bacterium]